MWVGLIIKNNIILFTGTLAYNQGSYTGKQYSI